MTRPSAPPAAAPPGASGTRRPLPARLAGWAVRAVLFLAVAWTLTIAAVHLYGRRDEAAPADAIVVLGAAHYQGRPSPVLRARLDHAIELYRRGLAPVIIMTGGTAPGDTVSEAVVGRRYAIRQGVPPEAVLTERAGMSTLQSLRAVSSLMRGQGMESAILVSDPFHMLRLKLLSLRVGIEGRTSPTRTSPISRNPAEERRHILRESLSLPYALVEGGR